jgi:hypothetical protein
MGRELGVVLAVGLAAAAGCREPTVPRRGDPTEAVGSAESGLRVARLEDGRSLGLPPADQTIALQAPPAPVAAVTAQGTTPVVVNLPAAGEDRLGEKGAEVRDDAGPLPGAVAVDQPPTKGLHRLPPRGSPSLTEPPAERRTGAPGDVIGPQRDLETRFMGGQQAPPEEGEAERAQAPLPPSPPPVQSPTSTGVAAPTLPAPAALRTEEPETTEAGRTSVVGRGGGLPPYTVRSLLRRREAGLQRCYDGLLLRDPGAGTGNLTVRLRIEPTGDLAQLERVGGTLEDAEFERCVLEQLRRVDFPAADTPTVFTHSFSFAPVGAAAPLTE